MVYPPEYTPFELNFCLTISNSARLLGFFDLTKYRKSYNFLVRDLFRCYVWCDFGDIFKIH